jgi:hypothetical protein
MTLEWTYSRRIDLRARTTWGFVLAWATRNDDDREWLVDAMACSMDDATRTLARATDLDAYVVRVPGGRANARMCMEALAERLAAHVTRARGGA